MQKVKLVVIKGNKRFNWWKFIFVSIFIFIVFLSIGAGVNGYTNSPNFCSSCHEMAPEYLTYSQSAHNKISCVQCHVPPGVQNSIQGKKDLLYEAVTYLRYNPTQITEKEKFAVKNENCLQCHSKNRLVTASGDLKVNHKGHIEKGIPCITCHAGVAHSKVAERQINLPKNLDYWTKSNTDKLISDKYVNPNMGTCIDCHDKVNKGQEPWKNQTYIIPKNSSQKIDKQLMNFKLAPGLDSEDKTQVNVEQQDKNTQGIILQALGKQTQNVKISMKCETCHRKIKVPNTHNDTQWSVNHGLTAMQELNKCLTCHQDSKWIKDVPTENIKDLLTSHSKEDQSKPTYQQVKDESRKNKFCSTCHSQLPPSHAKENAWNVGHIYAAANEDERLKCYICHDQEKPKDDNKTSVKAPTSLSCEDCHKNGFEGNLNHKIGG